MEEQLGRGWGRLGFLIATPIEGPRKPKRPPGGCHGGRFT